MVFATNHIKPLNTSYFHKHFYTDTWRKNWNTKQQIQNSEKYLAEGDVHHIKKETCFLVERTIFEKTANVHDVTTVYHGQQVCRIDKQTLHTLMYKCSLKMDEEQDEFEVAFNFKKLRPGQGYALIVCTCNFTLFIANFLVFSQTECKQSANGWLRGRVIFARKLKLMVFLIWAWKTSN